MLFPSTILVVTLGTGQPVIARCLVNSQLEYFLNHEMDMAVLPGGIYTKGIRYISGTSVADATFTRYNFWDDLDAAITPICNQQIVSTSIPNEALIDKFLTAIGQTALKPALFRPLLTFDNQNV